MYCDKMFFDLNIESGELNMKKFLSCFSRSFVFLLALGIVTSLLTVGRTALAEEITADRGVLEYLTALNVIGEYRNDNEWYNDYILRGEVAKLGCGMLNAAEIAEGSEYEKIFADVEAGSLNAQYINYISRIGLACGSGGMFYPKDKITYSEFVKIIMGVLGYMPEAEANGGYPMGYISIARRVGILDRDFVQDEYITRKSAYQMAVKAMEIDIMNYTGETSDAGNFQVVKGDNLLKCYHDIRTEEGVVTANRHTSLFSTDGVGENYIRLEDRKYRTIVSNADMFLGYAVKAYINSDDTIIYLSEDNNDTISVLASNISDATTKSRFVYYPTEDDAKTSNCAIDENASVIYNERYVAKAYTNLITDGDLMPRTGNVVLVDNNGDRKYDVVFISAYDTFVVNSATEEGMKIHIKNSDASIDCSGDEIYITDKFGNPLSLASLGEWNILAVAESRDKKSVSIIVLDNSVTGTLTEIGKDYLKIDGAEYKISKSFDYDAYKTEVGKRAVFYFDIENAVAAINYTNSSEFYGYLIKAQLTGVFNDSLLLKVFTENNDIKVYTCTKNITYNKYSDNMKLTPADMYKAIAEKGGSQLIKYVLNDNGELKELQLTTQGGDKEAFSLDFKGDSAHYVVGMINYKYFIPDTVKIFSVPEDKTDEDSYFIAAKKSLTGDKRYDNVELYDIDENNFVGAVVMNLGDAVDSGERGLIVDEIYTGIDEDDQPCTMLAGYYNGQYTTLAFAEDNIETLSEGVWGYDGVKSSELKCGDVIQVTKNAVGEINKFRLIFRPDPDVGYMYKNGTENTNVSKESFKHTSVIAAYSKVARKSTKSIIYDSENEKVINIQSPKTVPIVYVYDAKARTPLRVGQSNDIEAGDNILVLYNWSTVREIVIYRY